MNNLVGPQTKFSDTLHAQKYRKQGESFREAMNRVAAGLKDSDEHFHQVQDILCHMRFLPGGRIQAAIGSSKQITAHNCFLSGPIEDSFIEGEGSIMNRATEAAETMRRSGGIGYDFGRIRPRGTLIKSLQSRASGPISFMEIYNAVGNCVKSAGHRRGAQMGVLPIHHPDIEEFVLAKQNIHALTGFNISVGTTDEFMYALLNNDDFDLHWNGHVYKTVRAADLWEMIMRSTWDWAEPGILFIDRINEMNNLWYCEEIVATNPCLAKGTLVSTPEGYKKVEDLKSGDRIMTINGERPITSIESHTNMPVYEVEFTNGVRLKATANHIFHVRESNNKKWLTDRPLKTLSPGTKVRLDSTPFYPDARTDYEYNKGLVELSRNYCLSGDTHTTSIRSITPAGTATVYDLYEKDTDTWITEGIVNRGCGEQPLPPFSSCLLGSFNLTKYIQQKEDGTRRFLWDNFYEDIPPIVRAMDNVTDASYYPLPMQAEEARNKRRMGLGITGLANAGEALGLPYGSKKFIKFQRQVQTVLRDIAYQTSIGLADEKGAFPAFDAAYLHSKFIKTLPSEIQEDIKKYGIRNSHLLSIAPTGTISLCADNISSGIEPVFSYSQDREIQTFDGPELVKVEDYGLRVFGVRGKRASKNEVTLKDHMRVLKTASLLVDSSVSKTINVPPDTGWEDFKQIYMEAWKSGCKGCTTFNISGQRGGIIRSTDEGEGGACYIDPETGQKECG